MQGQKLLLVLNSEHFFGVSYNISDTSQVHIYNKLCKYGEREREREREGKERGEREREREQST
jgi:hypothetical protein